MEKESVSSVESVDEIETIRAVIRLMEYRRDREGAWCVARFRAYLRTQSPDDFIWMCVHHAGATRYAGLVRDYKRILGRICN